LDNDKSSDLLSWLGLTARPNFLVSKPLGALIGVLLTIVIGGLFGLAVLSAFKLLGTALFGNLPKGTASNFGLSGVIVAMIGAPLVVWRTYIAQEQTKTTKEALFNDKINAAVSDLHSQRQVTNWKDEKAQNGWEDDVTRRNGAIDRLRGLAKEEPAAAPRIARMLSVYVKELSREFKPQVPPETDNIDELRTWASNLTVERSDMQNAVQVLGQLRKESGHTLDNGEIDLTGTNLQGFDLKKLDFNNVSFENAQLQGADLFNAQLQGANLISAQLQGADLSRAQFDPATTLSAARFSYAALRVVDFSETSITQEQLETAFGDASVTLPDGKGPDDPEWPDHWSKEELDWNEFDTQWRKFQSDNGFDPNNPD
jgi:uncharacterized protein YjbI with pentapeptide repeats